MNSSRRKFHVHAELVATGGSASIEFDDIKAGRPIERRLNRMERVVVAFRGKIDKRFAKGLQVSFETADAALLGACEMQQRCAELPQVSRHRLALRIGIHRGLVRQRARDGADNAPEIAAQLAMADDAIVAAENVVTDLNEYLLRLTRPLENVPTVTTAFNVDWQSEITASAFGGESVWPESIGYQPAGPYLLLHHGLKTVELTRENPVAAIGRDPASDLVFVNNHVSRNHCRIERRADGIVLIDSSFNGTCIKPDVGHETLVKNDSAVLKGKGLLFFGRPFNGERRGGVRYEAY